MIFEILNEAADRGELFLCDGGLLHYHLRRDGVLTIREILVLPKERCRKLGRWMVSRVLLDHPEAVAVVAKCPVDLPSNGFWRAIGFTLVETSNGKRPVNTWRKELTPCG